MYQMNVMLLQNSYRYLKNNNKTSFEITYLLQIETNYLRTNHFSVNEKFIAQYEYQCSQATGIWTDTGTQTVTKT